MSKTWCCYASDSALAGQRPGSTSRPKLRSPRLAALALLAALGGVGLSTPVHAQYCAAGSANCGTAFDDERISHVSFAGIENDSGTGDGPAGCYTDFTSVSTTVQPGSSYPITITNAGVYPEDQCSVWIDWNQDLTFGVAGSGEQYILTSDGTGATFTGTIVVPSGASLGSTRMRVRIAYAGAVPPCGNTTYGEVEDYTVTVLSATTGACCDTSGACSQTVQGACAGTFQGLSTACTPNPCGGACCNLSTLACTVTTGATCPSGSLYIDHAACGPTSCSYCAAGSAACGTANDDERISHFTFNTIDNDSGTGDGPTGCYTDFTSISTTVFPGQTYPISVTNAGVYAADQAAVWFDFNNDLAFGDVASGEQISLASADGGATFTGSVTIPAGAHIGPTRLRVRVMYTGTLSPCGNAGFGEVEDYGLAIAVATTGACCQSSGACDATLPGACTGTFSGVGTSCAPSNPCGGACCNAGGTCSVTTAATCPGGSVYINNAPCTASVCNGACCDSLGVCTLAASAAACSGAFSGANTSCTPSPCPPPPNDECASAILLTVGAAPVTGTTLNATPSYATTPGWCAASTLDVFWKFTVPAAGNYGISMTNTVACSVIVMANCGDTTAIACSGTVANNFITLFSVPAAGTYYIRNAAFTGAGAQGVFSIEIHTVTAGACCNDTTGACTTVTTATCAAGATYQGDNTACSATQCGQGACCNPATGVCTLSTLAGCTGQFQSVATTCTVNPCPQPPTGACCNTASGACTNVFAANCPAASNYLGDNTSCDASGFCPAVGTCCSSVGSCSLRYSATCQTGLTANAATACTTSLCPAGPHTCENFDAAAAGALPANWTSTSSALGAPWVADATQSHSPSNAVFSNDVASVSSQFLVMPTVTAGGPLTLDLWSYFTTEATFDGWVVEYSTDGGGTWTDVGQAGWALNGYNVAAISANFASPIAGRPAFSGAGAAWTERIAIIPANNGDSVTIRFQMASDSSVASTGVWLDDICVGGIQSTGGASVCCRGATCNTTYATAAACTAALNGNILAGAAFSAAAACNAAGVTNAPCCYADYNKHNGIEVQDIFDFINDWLASSRFAIVGGNGNTGTLDVQNIFDFLNAWFAGGCS